MVEVIDLQLKYKLTPCMAQALWLLLTSKVVTPNMLELNAHHITTDAKVLMHRVRKRLENTGIKITCQRHTGYWLDAASREIILRDIDDEQMSLPFDHEGKGDKIAA